MCGLEGHGAFQSFPGGKRKGELKCNKHRKFLEQLGTLHLQHGIDEDELRVLFKLPGATTAATSGTTVGTTVGTSSNAMAGTFSGQKVSPAINQAPAATNNNLDRGISSGGSTGGIHSQSQLGNSFPQGNKASTHQQQQQRSLNPTPSPTLGPVGTPPGAASGSQGSLSPSIPSSGGNGYPSYLQQFQSQSHNQQNGT